MSFELKKGVNFPPEDRHGDKLLLKIARESEQGQYLDGDLVSFLKTGEGLYSQEDECRGMDDSTFAGFKEEREEIIKKYIQVISFLWQEEEDNEIELHIEHTFDDIEGIDIRKEIEAGRNQELNKLGKTTREVVFDLIDARSLLKNSETLEFNTTKEIFFFVLSLLGLENIAAYLNGAEQRVINYTMRRGDLDSISLVMNFISEQNGNDIVSILEMHGLPENKTPNSLASLHDVLKNISLNREELGKIKLKQKQS